MLEAARAGDAGCRRVIGDAGRALGQVVATLLNVLNPEMLIVGGDLAAAGDLLLDGIRESVARAALPETAAAPSSSRACSASARRCSARSRWWSRRPIARSRPGSHSPVRPG